MASAFEAMEAVLISVTLPSAFKGAITLKRSSGKKIVPSAMA